MIEYKTHDEKLPNIAYKELYGKESTKKLEIIYSKRLKNYNAHIISTILKIIFKLSYDYKNLDDVIKIGVMQHLLCKLKKTKKNTLNIDLYNKFLKNLGDYKTGSGGLVQDEELKASFDRVNKNYFDNYMITPTIRWGGNSKQRLGYYEFATDTITISTILRGGGEFLDYVIYHELLHKKHKFEHKNGRTRSHTSEFRRDERKFVMTNGSDSEKELTKYLRKKIRSEIVLQKNTKKNKEKKYFNIFKKLFDYF